MERVDLAVVGGGLSGWIAAVYAAKGGQQVVLFERSGDFGGRARTQTLRGARLNMGPHAIFRGGELWTALNELGVRVPGGVPSPRGHGLWRGKTWLLPTTPGTLAVSTLLNLKGKAELARIMTDLKRLDPGALPAGSFADWVDGAARHPVVRSLLHTFARTATYCAEPDLLSARSGVQKLKDVLGGVIYVDGGWSSVVEGLKRVGRSCGVKAFSGMPVRRVAEAAASPPQRGGYAIEFDGGRRIAADQVILAVPPGAASEIVEGAGALSLARWRSQARPIVVSCLDLVLRRLPKPGLQFVMGVDEPVMFTNHSRAADLSEGPVQVAHAVKYLGEADPDAKRDRAELERLMDRIQPGWREVVETSRFLPEMTVAYDFEKAAGPERPGPRVPDAPGLYVAGDWACHGELIADAAAASAKRAAAAAFADANLAPSITGGSRTLGLRSALSHA